MLMNDKIILGGYYCINFAEKKEIRCRNERNMVHYILQPTRRRFRFYARSGADFSFSLLARVLRGTQ